MGGTGGQPSPQRQEDVQSTVLVVEDEVLVRMAIAQQLRDAGYPVIEAASAQEALEVLRHRNVRLVFSDIRMPGAIDGVELARLIRAKYPAIRIVLTSGESRAPDWADGFFAKPYRAAQVLDHIKKLMG